jgi:hypothetical protein
MSSAKRKLVKYSINGVSREKLTEADEVLASLGHTPREREEMIAAGNPQPDDSVETIVEKAYGIGVHFSPDEPPEGDEAPEGSGGEAVHIDTFRAMWKRALISRGLSEVDAGQVVRRANLTNPNESPKLVWQRLRIAADEMGKPIPGLPSEPEGGFDAYQQEWIDFLTVRGMALPVAERLIRNTKFRAGERPEQAWQRIYDQARVSRIRLPNRTYDEVLTTPSLNTPVGGEQGAIDRFYDHPAGQALNSSAQRVSDLAQALGEWAEGIPTPGDLTAPLAVMIVLWFAVIPVLYVGQNMYTRLHLLFLALIGNAHLNDPNPPDPKIIPPGLMGAAVTTIADAAKEGAAAAHAAADVFAGAEKVADYLNPVSDAERLGQFELGLGKDIFGLGKDVASGLGDIISGSGPPPKPGGNF